MTTLHIPVRIYGDGNCLPRAASLLAFGTEEMHVEMQVRIAVGLLLHEDFYLRDSAITKVYAQYSEQFQMEELTAGAIQQVFRQEVKAVTPT